MPTPDETTTATATETPTSATATTTKTVKPGYKTTEFYMKLAAMLLTALYAGDAIPTSGTASKIAAIAATALTAIGYSVVRGMAKK